MGGIDSLPVKNTRIIFFTLGNVTCFLELMEKYSLETDCNSLPYLLPVANRLMCSCANGSIKIKSKAT